MLLFSSCCCCYCLTLSAPGHFGWLVITIYTYRICFCKDDITSSPNTPYQHFVTCKLSQRLFVLCTETPKMIDFHIQMNRRASLKWFLTFVKLEMFESHAITEKLKQVVWFLYIFFQTYKTLAMKFIRMIFIGFSQLMQNV